MDYDLIFRLDISDAKDNSRRKDYLRRIVTNQLIGRLSFLCMESNQFDACDLCLSQLKEILNQSRASGYKIWNQLIDDGELTQTSDRDSIRCSVSGSLLSFFDFIACLNKYSNGVDEEFATFELLNAKYSELLKNLENLKLSFSNDLFKWLSNLYASIGGKAISPLNPQWIRRASAFMLTLGNIGTILLVNILTEKDLYQRNNDRVQSGLILVRSVCERFVAILG